MLAREPKGLRSVVLQDALDRADVYEEDNADGYIREIATHGCVGGSCSGLVYCKDTHAFYNKNADEIDELIERLHDEMGYNVHENMQRLGQSDLRNFLAWLAYEVTAQELLAEINPNE